MTLEELIAQQAQLQQQAQSPIPRIQAQTDTVDLRPRAGETQEAYRARIEAARPMVRESPGTQQMNAFAEAALSIQDAAPPVGVLQDVVRSGAAGIGRGVIGLATLPAAADNLIRRGLMASGVMPTAEDMQAQGAPANVAQRVEYSPLGPRSVLSAADRAVGGALTYDPQTTAGEFAGTVGEFLPGGVVAGAPMVYGVVPGVASEAAGQMTEGTAAEPWARLGAAVVAPAVAQVATAPFFNPGAVSRAVFGSGDPSQERQAAAALLERFGVPMTAGQRVGVEDMLRREMLTNAGRRIADQQTEAFTRAVLSTIGETATRATPDVMDAARTRIGNVFESIQRNTDVLPDPTTAQRVQAVSSTYTDSANVAARSPIIERIATEVADAAQSGTPIPASTMARWRSITGNLLRSGDAATREAAGDIREILDDSLNQVLTAAGRTDDIARLAEARAQWRNYLALVRVTSGAGANTAEGLISPSALRSAVANQDRTAYATGNRGEIADLARAGETILRLPPNSGTPSGMRALYAPEVMTGVGGATVGGSLDLPALGTIGLGLAAAGAPATYRAAQMTPWVQNALAQQGPPLLMPGYVNALAGFAAP
jgi:hypothetical protein